MLAGIAAALACAGVAQAVGGWLAVRRFAAQPPPVAAELPAVTVLRPLYGDEPLLEQALASACAQDYPAFQVIFGVQNPADPALAVAERVRARFPEADVLVLRDDTADGPNRKVANLINMLPHAKHNVLVIADSDIHVAPDYLRRIVAALQQPETGLVTTLYRGLPANGSVAAALGASAIAHGFLPGAVLSRALGRQDCLGATMALRRGTLAAIGGLAALLPHLADDNVLGRLVRAQGLAVRLAATVPATTVPEARLAALWRHELRWARTIQAAAPLAFVASAVQYPLAWAMIAVLLTSGAAWSLAALAMVWAARGAVACGIGRALRGIAAGPEVPVPIWWLPLRDVMSLAVTVASFASDRVEWRGRQMRTR